MSEWKDVKLGDIATVKGGKRLPKDHDLIDTITDHPYIRARDIKNGKINFNDPKYLTDNTFSIIKNYIVTTGDTIITIVGANIGDVAYVNKQFNKANLTENAVRITAQKDNIDPLFLYYILTPSERKEYFQQVASGAAQDKLGLYKIKKTPLQIPPLPTQKKIAKILSNYDDLIENNLKRIKLLEESARLTYEEWFLRFRIDGEKLEIDSETGLPFGWEKKKLNALCQTISSGGTPSRSKKEFWNSNDYDWITTKELKDCFIYATKEKISSLGLNKSSAKLFSKGTVIMAIYASPTLGRLGIMTKESCFNQAAVGFIVDDKKISNEFLYLKLKDERIGLNALAIGAAQQNINVAKVRNYEVVLPDFELLSKFTLRVRVSFTEIENLGYQNQLLKEARDILLPRLMTGMIDVENMEIAV